MRAALPHLRLLTLPIDQISRLSKYLTSEEKTFLPRKMVFKEDSGSEEVPPSLNIDINPRILKAIHISLKTLELIPEKLIITDHHQMDYLSNPIENPVFSMTFAVCQGMILKSVEILTQAKKNLNLRRTAGR